jgi:ribosomal protein L17
MRNPDFVPWVEMAFAEPMLDHARPPEKSADSRACEVCEGQSTLAVRSPYVANRTGYTRCLKMTFRKGKPGL